MQAIILVGGLGTRLNSVVNDRPKSMALINGKPFIHYLFKYLENNGIKNVYLLLGYKKEFIKDFILKSQFSLSFNFVEEDEPLGTGGAIKKLISEQATYLDEHFFVFNGDTYFPINLKQFLSFHIKKSSDISIALYSVLKNTRYSSVSLTNENKVKAFIKADGKMALINGGIYIFKKDKLIKSINKINDKKFSIENDFFGQRALSELGMYGIFFDTKFIDIGIPEDYARAGDIISDNF